MANETKEQNNNLNEETGLNRQFFQEVIENSNISEESKKHLGKFKDFKNDTVGEVLKVEDKDKIKAYDRLKVKELPEDWELKLERLKELEKHEADYLLKKEELKGWTDTFGEKKPLEVSEEIKSLEAKNKEIEEELITEKENHSLTEKELKQWEEILPHQSPILVKEKLNELEAKVKEWMQFFDYRELEEIKGEIEELRKRPDISISAEQFWDDFAQRKSLELSELTKQELEQEREKVAKLKHDNEYFLQVANQILENMRFRRYALDEPVITVEKAQAKIAKLLEGKEKELADYFQGENSNKELDFELSIYPEKKALAQQVLTWIKEARETSDYQKLYQQWNGGRGYNKEHDFVDGSLSLLKRYLEVLNNEGHPPESKEILSPVVDQSESKNEKAEEGEVVL